MIRRHITCAASAAGLMILLLLPSMTLGADARPWTYQKVYDYAVLCAAADKIIPGGWDEVDSRTRTQAQFYKQASFILGGHGGLTSEQVSEDLENQDWSMLAYTLRANGYAGKEADRVSEYRQYCADNIGRVRMTLSALRVGR